MDKPHEDASKKSVEENLSANYVPKSKIGDLPISNKIDEALKQKQEKIKKDVDKLVEELTKKYNFLEGIGIVPAQANKKIEDEYEISEEDRKRELNHIIVIIPESQFKNIGPIRLEAINMAKKINPKFWVHVLTPVDLWNLGLDSKYDIFEAFSMSFPLKDKGLLGALRAAQIHKSLVLRKFEKYVTSYVLGGSLVRGEATKTSDVDVFIIIDDTDVKQMTRLELKEKLRSIIFSYIQEAQAIAGIKNILSVQTYLLTEFWDSVKEAQPVMFTFIRDGIPLYDRGAFLPWKSLLRMGKIRPSPEAIDMFMSAGNKLKEIVDRRVFDIAVLDLFHGVSTPTQGLLMLYGQSPGTVYETVKSFRETFVEKEKMVEKEYADILEEISIKYYKGFEHNKIKPGDISGTKLDELTKKSLKYINRLKKLREQIEKRVQEKKIKEVYENLFGMLKNLLGKTEEKEIISTFEKELIKKAQFQPRFLESLRRISKLKDEIINRKGKSKKEESILSKTNEVSKAERYANEIINAITEYNQRCDFLSLDRTRFKISGKSGNGEVFFLKNIFLVEGATIRKVVNDSLVDSDTEELKNQMAEHKTNKSKISHSSLETLKKIFGEFELEY